ncbi:ABC transporter ATP-binding protein [Brevibacterium casei]|uniref:ABC transporter ATP-binding protein n=1 Tax=Brevibacterium TaxID=1696 RepID=UPI00186B8CDC|nr:ABC transporter ATP-binding protein [Brevibacterium casei]MBE4694399.1 ABC transporter ATP-binding protein [Brevibacterium casei]MBY3577521.1 ABC transporter ATP-binding protein [Brevibacterium casei]MCT2357586.1 ABC transporter ATP-binding protein [Brevibacterium casei]QZE25523.1 ABC transporter ATP-binding protein [Brevibacterium casei]
MTMTTTTARDRSPGTSSAAIELDHVVKSYGRVRALDGLDLTVDRGEVHGFLGPNGAGKSTTIRILLGILRHDRGRVRLLGEDPWSQAVSLHRRLAYVPGDVELWPGLTGGEAIDLFSRLRGGVDERRRDELIERFDLDPRKKGRTYSKGNRQKVALISALASNVELLLLDEPTAGLDPLMEAVFQECIREAKEQGRTVLLSSHILAQVEALADRVSIIRAGRIVESGALADLRHLSRTTVTVQVVKDIPELTRMSGVHDLVREGRQLHFSADTAQLPGIMRALGEHDIESLTATPPTLEQLLLRHYGTEES